MVSVGSRVYSTFGRLDVNGGVRAAYMPEESIDTKYNGPVCQEKVHAQRRSIRRSMAISFMQQDSTCQLSTCHPGHTLPTLHVAQPQVIEGSWRLKILKRRACEHHQWPESTVCVLTDEESKIASRSCGASPQFTSIPLISANIQISH